jgi:hypothetical protein
MCSFLHGAICLPITEAIPLEILRSFQLTISLGQGKKILTFNYKKVTHLDKPESNLTPPSTHPPPKNKKGKERKLPTMLLGVSVRILGPCIPTREDFKQDMNVVKTIKRSEDTFL